MAQLYTVTFTTKTLVKKYDAKGKLVSEFGTGNPIVMSALPYQTAMSYAKCENFKITPYEMEQPRRSKGSGRDSSIGNGTKKVSYSRTDATGASKSLNVKPARSAVADAAATGNLGAALNA